VRVRRVIYHIRHEFQSRPIKIRLQLVWQRLGNVNRHEQTIQPIFLNCKEGCTGNSCLPVGEYPTAGRSPCHPFSAQHRQSDGRQPCFIALERVGDFGKITANINVLNVYGGLDGVTNDRVRLTERGKPNS
jgi:hypothetical protein